MRPSRPRSLFPDLPPEPRDPSPVTIALRVLDQTEKAWLLVCDGRKSGAAWAPKSELTRGEGHQDCLFTMPRWIARERGWL